MSQVCIECSTGITSTDTLAIGNICGSCLYSDVDGKLELAENIVKALIDGCDVHAATEYAFEYREKYG